MPRFSSLLFSSLLFSSLLFSSLLFSRHDVRRGGKKADSHGDWPFVRFSSVLFGERGASDRSLRGCLACTQINRDVVFLDKRRPPSSWRTTGRPSSSPEVIIARTKERSMRVRIVLLGILLVCTSIQYADSRSKKTTQLSLQSKETNVVNFMRLLMMRLVFGVASAMGLGENLSGVLGGIFVPPGAEEYNEEYGDDDLIVPDIF